MAAIKQDTTGMNLKSLSPNSSLAQRSLKQKTVKAPELTTLQVPSRQVSPQASLQGLAQTSRVASQATNDLASRLSQFSNLALRQGNQAMQVEAREKATQDVLSGEKVAVDLTTIYGQAYSSAAMATYSAEVGLNAKLKASEMKTAAAGNAEVFKKNYEAYENEILSTAPNAESKAAAQRRFKAYGEAGYTSILQENQKKDQNYQRGTWQKNATSTTSDTINLLNNGLAKDAEESLQAFILQGHALVEAGTITEGQRAQQTQKVRSDVQRETHRFSFNGIVDKNIIQAELEARTFSAEIPEGMSVATHRAIQSDMRSSIITKVKTDKANNKAQVAYNDDIADKAITVLKSGSIPIDFQQALDLNLSPKKQIELNTAIALLDSSKEFNSQTIPQQEHTLNIMRSIENPTAENVVELQHLDKLYSHNVSLAKNDPIQLAVEQGFIVPPAPVSPNDMSALSNRASTATQISSLYSVEPKLLTRQESEQFQTAYGNGDYKQKIDIVSGIVNSLDSGSASKVFSQIAKKGGPQIKYAGMMVGGGNRNIAEIAAKGETVKLPLPSGFNEAITAHIGNALSHTKDGHNTFFEGGKNYYKGKALMSGEEYDLDDALIEGLGAKARYNGKDILLPSGKDKGDFEDHINLLTPDMIPNVMIDDKDAFVKQLQGTTDFWITGKSNDIKYVQRGYGKYGVTIKNQNVMQQTEDGAIIPYMIEFR